MHHTARSLAAWGAVALLLSPACSKSGTPPEGEALNGEPEVVTLLKDPAVVGDFSVVDLDGKTISLGALRGKVVFVNFWATWCPPCRQEIPDLIRLQEKYRDDVVVLGISEDEAPPETVRAFAAQYKMNYFITMTKPELTKVFRGVAALPTTFVIDRDGKIVQRHVGQLNPERTELEAAVLTGRNTNVRIERAEDPAKLSLQNAAQATSVPGIDLTMLSPAQRTAAIQALNAEDCTCGCGLTLAECRINDPECTVSLPLAKERVKQLAASIAATGQ